MKGIAKCWSISPAPPRPKHHWQDLKCAFICRYASPCDSIFVFCKLYWVVWTAKRNSSCEQPIQLCNGSRDLTHTASRKNKNSSLESLELSKVGIPDDAWASLNWLVQALISCQECTGSLLLYSKRNAGTDQDPSFSIQSSQGSSSIHLVRSGTRSAGAR